MQAEIFRCVECRFRRRVTRRASRVCGWIGGVGGGPRSLQSPRDFAPPERFGGRDGYPHGGANGAAPGDAGDTLSYSAASGDVDGDGRIDLITNEMVGNGIAGQVDVGNLIVLSGAGLISPPETPTLPGVGYGALAVGLAVVGALQLRRRLGHRR